MNTKDNMTMYLFQGRHSRCVRNSATPTALNPRHSLDVKTCHSRGVLIGNLRKKAQDTRFSNFGYDDVARLGITMKLQTHHSMICNPRHSLDVKTCHSRGVLIGNLRKKAQDTRFSNFGYDDYNKYLS